MATLELRNVNKTYGPGLPDTLKNIELSIKDGEFLILVGPSGCGKSTLMNCIAGLETITGGAIMIGDQDVSGVEGHESGPGGMARRRAASSWRTQTVMHRRIGPTPDCLYRWRKASQAVRSRLTKP